MSELEALIEAMPRGASLYRRETIPAWEVCFPEDVPNRRNQFKKFTDENLVVALKQAAAWWQHQLAAKRLDGAAAQ